MHFIRLCATRVESCGAIGILKTQERVLVKRLGRPAAYRAGRLYRGCGQMAYYDSCRWTGSGEANAVSSGR